MNRVKSTILETSQTRQGNTTFCVVSSALLCLLLAGCIASAPLAPLDLNSQNIDDINLSQPPVLGPNSVELNADGDLEGDTKPIIALSHTAQSDDFLSAIQTQVTPLQRPDSRLASDESTLEEADGDISKETTSANVGSARPSIFQRLFNRNSTQQQPIEKVTPKPQQVAKKSNQTSSPALFTSLVSDTDNHRPIKDQEASGKATSDNELPGVKNESLFDKIFGSNKNDDREDKSKNGSPLIASTAGFARFTPSDLIRQHKGVRVNCFKPALLKILKRVEHHYGKKVIVTSGYRSPAANRRAGGVNNSMHVYCAAADIQVSGVSKWSLAKYLRSLSGRGGVGTYCHTKSVHIDIGSERDWNRKCRKAKRRRG